MPFLRLLSLLALVIMILGSTACSIVSLGVGATVHKCQGESLHLDTSSGGSHELLATLEKGTGIEVRTVDGDVIMGSLSSWNDSNHVLTVCGRKKNETKLIRGKLTKSKPQNFHIPIDEISSITIQRETPLHWWFLCGLAMDIIVFAISMPPAGSANIGP